MSGGNQLTVWQLWVRQPQRVWLRRALFQVHLWSAIAVGLYILMMSVTGSVLVYRNELYRATTPEPIISKGSGPRLTDGQLAEAARHLYPGYRVVKITRPLNLDQAVDVWLDRGEKVKKRMFDPRSGSDLGDSVPTGIWLVSRLLGLHDNLLAGPTGLKVNGVGALALLALAGTGMAVWWPGIKAWRRSLTLHRGVGWKRFTWHLHSMIGFWSLGFMLVFALAGSISVVPRRFRTSLTGWSLPLPRMAGCALATGLFIGSPFYISAALTGSGFLVAAPGSATRRPKRFGHYSDWPPRRCL